MTDAETIRTLRAIIEEQAEEIRQLRQEALAPLPTGLPYLTQNEELVLRSLLKRPMTVEGLFLATARREQNNHDVEPTELIRQYIHRLRRKLIGTGITIKTIHRRGYEIKRTNEL